MEKTFSVTDKVMSGAEWHASDRERSPFMPERSPSRDDLSLSGEAFGASPTAVTG
jgi:hypothetical protein